MSKPSPKNRRIRIYVSKKKYEKINEHAKKEGLSSGTHIIDDMMCDFIDENNL